MKLLPYLTDYSDGVLDNHLVLVCLQLASIEELDIIPRYSDEIGRECLERFCLKIDSPICIQETERIQHREAFQERWNCFN